MDDERDLTILNLLYSISELQIDKDNVSALILINALIKYQDNSKYVNHL